MPFPFLCITLCRRFNALVSSGTSPNNAALEALNEVRKILSERTQSASTETKPSRESTPQLISEHQPDLLNPRSVSGETVADIIDEATASNSFVSLIRAVGWVFSDYDTLADSFLPNPGIRLMLVRVCYVHILTENHTHLDGGPPVPTAYQGVFPRSSNTANFNCPCIDFSGLDVSFALLLELKEGGEDAVDNAMWSAIDRLSSDLLGQVLRVKKCYSD